MRAGGDSRAVSDVLAFVIVFSIIITSVGVTYGIGFSSLGEFQEGEQKTNAARAFQALSVSLDDIQEGAAPGRSGAIQLNEGTLQVEEQSQMTVEVALSNGTTWTVASETTGSLQYSFENTDVAYENGAVFRKDGSASVMIEEPSFLCSESSDQAVVSIVVLNSDSNAIGGEINAEIISRQNDTDVLYPNLSRSSSVSADNVTVDVPTSNFDQAWTRYFEDTDGWEDPDNDGDFTCDADNVIVRVTFVEVEFQ
ncbi:hypothetical protein [Haloarchaeobius sp. HME9146]|uniref:DUF7289 family protein n=1 Tax=Haloarchaeobius sp. HME9146 TaxID=2978732 RepID=UPI0021BEE36D|nr:hypothetical protein [Haloarchaeobius sp. HME9146]MCT9096276.1 hypothetical protein [Haloarchaeobius sp. HME9146]